MSGRPPNLTLVPPQPPLAARIAAGQGKPAAAIAAVVVALFAGLQIWFAASSFKDLSHLTSGQPILNVDWCTQYYWAQAARSFDEYQDRIWGYDPHFMAGYPLDFVFNSSLPVQLAAVTFSSANLARVIKACFIASFALVPLCFYFALRAFDLPRWPALAAAAVAVAYFQVSENALFGRWGMIAGAFALAFFLLPLGTLLRYLKEPETAPLAISAAAVAIAFTIHKTSFILIVPAALIWAVIFFPQIRLGKALAVIAVLAAAFVANLYWLLPFFKFLALKIEDPGTTFFQNTDPLRILKDLWPFLPHPHFAIPLARLGIIAAGVIGLIRLRRSGDPRFFPLLSAITFMGVFAYFGSFVPFLRHLQPYRFATAFFYLWLPAAGEGLIAIYRRIALRRPRTALPATAALLAAYLLGVLLLPSYRSFSRLAPLSTELDQPSLDMIAWLREHTNRTARILFEDVNTWDEAGPPVYNGAKLASLMPLAAPGEYIGGPLPNAFIKHHYASFEDGRLCGRPAAEISDAELKEILDLYNIGWAVCWSGQAKAGIQGRPGVTLEATFDYIEVYSFKRDRTFFLQGRGEITADFGQITLSRLSTKTGAVVISYHWSPGLVSMPEARIGRIILGEDPAGFISVEDPPPGLVIKLGPALSW